MDEQISQQNPAPVVEPQKFSPYHRVHTLVGLIVILIIGGAIAYLVCAKIYEVWPFEIYHSLGVPRNNLDWQPYSTEEIAGWKTYHSESLGLEFQYPEDLATAESVLISLHNPKSMEVKKWGSAEYSAEFISSIRILRFLKKDMPDMERLDVANYNSQEYVINGRKAVKQTPVNKDGFPSQQIIIDYGTSTIYVTLTADDNQQILSQSIDKIAESIRVVTTNLTPEQSLEALAKELEAGNYEGALKWFGSDETGRDKEFIMSLDEKTAKELAQEFREVKFKKKINDNYLLYGLPFREENGTITDVEIALCKTGADSWVVCNW